MIYTEELHPPITSSYKQQCGITFNICVTGKKMIVCILKVLKYSCTNGVVVC